MLSVKTTICALFVAFGLAACAATPPIQEMSDARQAISAAETADAETLAAETLTEAGLLLTSAERYLKIRAYSAARRDALLAKEYAMRARDEAEAAGSDTSRD